MNLMNSAGLNYELLIIMRERIYEQKQRVDVECPVYYNISGSANELICEDGHLITENGKNNNKKTTLFPMYSAICTRHQQQIWSSFSCRQHPITFYLSGGCDGQHKGRDSGTAEVQETSLLDKKQHVIAGFKK